MYLILFPFVVGQLFILARLSKIAPLGLKSRWVHPFNLLGVFMFLTLIDFGVLLYDLNDPAYVRLLGFNLTMEGANSAYIYFVLWTTLTVSALWLATATKNRALQTQRPAVNRFAGDVVFAVGLFFALAALIVVLRYSLSMGGLFYVAGNRMQFLADNAFAFIGISLLLPSFIYFLYERRLSKVTVLAGLGCILLQSLFGQRSDPIMIAISLAYVASLGWGNLQAPVLYLALPIGGWLITVLGYAYRFSEQFSDLNDYIADKGGWLGVLFRGYDIALAESNTSTFASMPLLYRDWYESLLGAILAMVPRDLIPWKPLGASTHYTMVVDAEAWELYRRELVVGGPSNMYLDFGFIGGALVTALLFYIWARLIVRADRKGTGAFWGPVAILALYAFARNDLYSCALVLWPVAIMSGIYFIVSMIIRAPMVGTLESSRLHRPLK